MSRPVIYSLFMLEYKNKQLINGNEAERYQRSASLYKGSSLHMGSIKVIILQ